MATDNNSSFKLLTWLAFEMLLICCGTIKCVGVFLLFLGVCKFESMKCFGCVLN